MPQRQLARRDRVTQPHPGSHHPDRPHTDGHFLTRAVQECLELSICILAGQERPEHLQRLQHEASCWARDGIPIDTILRLVHDGVRLAIDLVTRSAVARIGPAGRRHTIDSDVILDLLSTITSTVAGAYARQPHTTADPHHATRALATALLEGRPTSALIRHGGIGIADEYWVLALTILRCPDSLPPRADSDMATAVPLRRVRAELADRFRGAALDVLSLDGGTVLVPTALATDPGLDVLVADLSRVAGVPLAAAVTKAEIAAIPAAADRAHELLDLAARLGMSGLHRFDDLALEYQLTRPGPGLDQLSALLDPLDDYPELLGTLRCFIANDQSRKRTANRLHLHPNSVDYRLKRIAQLTGLDVSRSTGLWYLRSALIARSHRRPIIRTS
ncbi:helix-turn-helix domain-containing protein [Nocardia elegans]|uniref:PucR family transcriptional regulator n=1 Tax=Nocardia elegans TaxID=300029 RepID=UPI001895439A|nr:helix-turn-helix domain-containing protein [Nocardia elegans]MBF6245776.1 helix-turn-helix domain-containing protein [Nocardia elegans]